MIWLVAHDGTFRSASPFHCHPLHRSSRGHSVTVKHLKYILAGTIPYLNQCFHSSDQIFQQIKGPKSAVCFSMPLREAWCFFICFTNVCRVGFHIVMHFIFLHIKTFPSLVSVFDTMLTSLNFGFSYGPLLNVLFPQCKLCAHFLT